MNEDTGMNFDRGCTDMVCVIIFLAFLSAMFGTLFWGVVTGDPYKMIQPYDFANNICGISTGVENYPNLYFT